MGAWPAEAGPVGGGQHNPMDAVMSRDRERWGNGGHQQFGECWEDEQ